MYRNVMLAVWSVFLWPVFSLAQEAPPTQEENQKKVQALMQQYLDAPVMGFNVEGEPVVSGFRGPIQIVEFADVLCPTCRSISAAFKNMASRMGDRATIYFKNYPLENWCNPKIEKNHHPGACWLALGLICSQEQQKFDPFYEKVFTGEPPVNPQAADVVTMASSVGLDGKAMESCLQSDKAKSTLASQIDEAVRAGVSGTPSIFVNGKKISHLGLFVTILDMESQKIGFAPFKPENSGTP